MNTRLTIGQLAKLTSVPPKTIRYYEEVGVLPPSERSESRYRLYSETDVRRLELIRRARARDMTLPEVRELVEWASSGTCNDFQGRFLEVVRRKLEEVDQKLSSRVVRGTKSSRGKKQGKPLRRELCGDNLESARIS